MKNFSLLFLVFALVVAAMPFVADATIEKSDVITVSVCFSDGRIEDIELEDYVMRVLAAREGEVTELEAKKGVCRCGTLDWDVFCHLWLQAYRF